VKRVAVVALLVLVALGVSCRWLLRDLGVNAPLGHMLFGVGGGAPDPDTFASHVEAAPGFRAAFFARDVENARGLLFTGEGDLLVTDWRGGRVLLLEPDRDGDGLSDRRRAVLKDLDKPYGLELRDGWLYVGETDAIGRARFDAESGEATGRYEHIVTGLPTGGHWTRTLGFGDDGWLYVAIGSSCNVCEEEDPRRAAIVRYRPDGSGEEIHATGLRNSAGFAWRPETGELYATDNGRDWLGDDFPPCELNRIVPGGFYGWPYVNGFGELDPDLGPGHEKALERAIPPVHGFPAHTAPLGIAFLRGEALPAAYRGAAVVALHGSWNRSEKIGYEVVSLHWGPEGRIDPRPFLTGLLADGDVLGRPVDVAQGPDGAIYVSDDFADAVYRVAPEPESGR